MRDAQQRAHLLLAHPVDVMDDALHARFLRHLRGGLRQIFRQQIVGRLVDQIARAIDARGNAFTRLRARFDRGEFALVEFHDRQRLDRAALARRVAMFAPFVQAQQHALDHRLRRRGRIDLSGARAVRHGRDRLAAQIARAPRRPGCRLPHPIEIEVGHFAQADDDDALGWKRAA